MTRFRINLASGICFSLVLAGATVLGGISLDAPTMWTTMAAWIVSDLVRNMLK